MPCTIICIAISHNFLSQNFLSLNSLSHNFLLRIFFAEFRISEFSGYYIQDIISLDIYHIHTFLSIVTIISIMALVSLSFIFLEIVEFFTNYEQKCRILYKLWKKNVKFLHPCPKKTYYVPFQQSLSSFQ